LKIYTILETRQNIKKAASAGEKYVLLNICWEKRRGTKTNKFFIH
jgi:hypothetical protein